MDTLDESLIRKHLPEELKCIGITVFDTIDSTNRYAKELDANNPQLVIADTQTAGRGRLGKSFYSPDGTGIYMSIAVNTPSSPDCITIATAVSIATVFRRHGCRDIGIKWVNDIFYERRKVCGILCENTGNKIIIGVGINLTTKLFPKDIAEIAGALNLETDRNTVIADITAEVFKTLAMSPAEIISEYKKYLFILGQSIVYTKDGITKKGIATDVNEKGNLIVKTDKGEDILISGEISLGSSNFI
ncbi:MAG: biotin--[acetyl-CoA-carboxylase] ligase [Clostridia bacterium]|nr:biotin--[acetyl-CoA-carboxylase] ligase [Clostridia bacterium]